MYDSSRIKNNKPITLDYILSKVSEQDIYTHYIGEFKVGMIYNSPFRKDKNPSFGIFYSKKSNKLLFKDHGTGICGDIIKFVSLYTGLTNYDAILNNIVESLKITKKTKLSNESNYYQSSETVIGVVRQPFTDKDLLYWKQYAISKTTLNKYDVHSIKYYLCNGYVKGIYKDENPMYAYKVYNHFKIYRPKGDKFTKWRNNLTEFDIQGYAQLPETGDILFITKSLKDVMSLHEMGYNAISPSSESTFIPQTVLDTLKPRFKRIIILFDRDKAGIVHSRKESLKTGLYAMFIHKKYGCKDISDAIAMHGIQEIKKWLTKTIKQ